MENEEEESGQPAANHGSAQARPVRGTIINTETRTCDEANHPSSNVYRRAQSDNDNAALRSDVRKNVSAAGARKRGRRAKLPYGVDNDNQVAMPSPAHTGENAALVGVRRHCAKCGTSPGLTCESHVAKSATLRILTNLPEQIPVLSQEIALLQTYWGAILDIMAANDNDP